MVYRKNENIDVEIKHEFRFMYFSSFYARINTIHLLSWSCLRKWRNKMLLTASLGNSSLSPKIKELLIKVIHLWNLKTFLYTVLISTILIKYSEITLDYKINGGRGRGGYVLLIFWKLLKILKIQIEIKWKLKLIFIISLVIESWLTQIKNLNTFHSPIPSLTFGNF